MKFCVLLTCDSLSHGYYAKDYCRKKHFWKESSHYIFSFSSYLLICSGKDPLPNVIGTVVGS